jgi:DNA-binding transcriptional MocR family regulator
MASLREQVAASLRRFSVPAEASNILLTQGATQALDLVVRTLLRPGDTVIVEDPVLLQFITDFAVGGAQGGWRRANSRGHDFDQLERVLKESKPKAIFINTVLQNPSGSSLSAASAQRLLDMATRDGVWIIEDDIYRELAPPEAPCLAALEGLEPCYLYFWLF